VSNASRDLLFVTAALLEQGQAVNRLSCGLTAAAIAVLAILPALTPQTQWTSIGFAAAAAAAGLAQTWFAIRVGFDAALFHRLASTGDAAAIDAALTGLGLMPAGKAGRPAPVRIAGARRLFRLQIAALALQVLCLLAGAGVGLTSG
jgi:hypothetical protein